VAARDLASQRSIYQRRRTLFEHQQVACETLEFHWLSDAQPRAFVRVLGGELVRTSDRQRLLQFARRWIYEHRLIVPRERDLRTMIIEAMHEHEAAVSASLLLFCSDLQNLHVPCPSVSDDLLIMRSKLRTATPRSRDLRSLQPAWQGPSACAAAGFRGQVRPHKTQWPQTCRWPQMQLP
jgi:hypothetical protein